MERSNIKKSKYIFEFAFFVVLLLVIDRILYSVAIINDRFIFGLTGNNYVAILISIVLLTLMFFLIVKNNSKYYFTFSLLLAGAFSNILERIYYGGVVDYINIFFIPTFNIADLLIIFSLALMISQGLLISNKKISQ